MIIETITAKPGQKDIIIEKSQYLIESTRLKSACVSYHVYASTENKDFLLMMDHWKNPAVLEENMQNEDFMAFNTAIGDIMAELLDMLIYSVDKNFFNNSLSL